MSFAQTLRHRITVQALPEGTDANGDPSKDWTDVCTIWANIRVSSGMERIRAGASTSTVPASIRIRARRGLDAGMRVVHGSAIYDIQAVPPAELGAVYMDLVCEVSK